jgi:ribosomal protein L28
MRQCEICASSRASAINVSYSNNQPKRRREPDLREVRALIRSGFRQVHKAA